MGLKGNRFLGPMVYLRDCAATVIHTVVTPSVEDIDTVVDAEMIGIDAEYAALCAEYAVSLV